MRTRFSSAFADLVDGDVLHSCRPLPVVDRQPSTNVGSGSSTSSIFTAAHDEAQDEMHIDDEVLPHEGLDWETHIAQWLSPWDERGITFDQIDLAATALANTTHLHEQV